MQLTARIRRRLPDDRGLTLIELLVVIAILGIIVMPLSNALISFFQRSTETTNRLSESHDAQIAAAYFAQDVQSVGVHDWGTVGVPFKQSIALNVGPAATPFPCGPPGTPVALLRMAWDDPSVAQNPGQIVVSYVLEPVGGQQQLHRIRCSGGTVTSDIVLAHNVTSVDPPVCSTSCTGTTPPETVTLTLHLRVKGTNDPDYVVTLTGQRRQT